MWWGDIPTPTSPSETWQVAVLCWREQGSFLHCEGSLPILCSRTAQEQLPVSPAPWPLQNCLQLPDVHTSGMPLQAGNLTGKTVSKLSAWYWRDQIMISEEADEFWGFMVLKMQRKWCAFWVTLGVISLFSETAQGLVPWAGEWLMKPELHSHFQQANTGTGMESNDHTHKRSTRLSQNKAKYPITLCSASHQQYLMHCCGLS